MQTAYIVEHETISDIDHAKRPYVLALTHYRDAKTGELIRTRGRVINSAPSLEPTSMITPEAGSNLATSDHCHDRDNQGIVSDDSPTLARGTEGTMLSWRIMKATEMACGKVCRGEEAADYYGETYNLLDRWNDWCAGFVAGWIGDDVTMPLTRRFSELIRRKLAGTMQ